MQLYRSSTPLARVAWTGADVARLRDAAVKLRWADRPFRWHANRGEEVFAVLSGAVDMHVRRTPGAGVEVIRLDAGDFLHLREGEEHVAHPCGEARILIVEEAGE